MMDALGLKDALYAAGAALVVGISKYLDNKQGKGIDNQIQEQKAAVTQTSTDIERRLDELKATDKAQWNAIDKLKDADSTHEKDDWKTKSELELKIASLDGIVGKLDGKMDSIGSKIDEMQKSVSARLDKIENNMSKN